MTDKKDLLLNAAEVIDALRVVPRTIIVCYGFFVWYVINWFLVIPNPTTGQTALVTTVAGSIPVVIGLYQNSGRRWGPYGNKSWGSSSSYPKQYNPTIVLPPVQPNINIGGGQPPTPESGNPAGYTAGPYDDRDLYDEGRNE